MECFQPLCIFVSIPQSLTHSFQERHARARGQCCFFDTLVFKQVVESMYRTEEPDDTFFRTASFRYWKCWGWMTRLRVVVQSSTGKQSVEDRMSQWKEVVYKWPPWGETGEGTITGQPLKPWNGSESRIPNRTSRRILHGLYRHQAVDMYGLMVSLMFPRSIWND